MIEPWYALTLEERKRMDGLAEDLKELRTLGGDHTWTTDEGPIVIDVKADTVLVTEGLEAPVTNQFRQAVLATPPVAR